MNKDEKNFIVDVLTSFILLIIVVVFAVFSIYLIRMNPAAVTNIGRDNIPL